MRLHLAPHGLALVAALLVWALPAGATSPDSPVLARAQKQMEEGAFEDAVKTLERGLLEEDLTDDLLVEFYRRLGLAQLYLGDEERARAAYEKLLQARPDYQLSPSEPPKIRALYARIREDLKTRRVRPVQLQVEPLTEVPAGAPLSVRALVRDLPIGARTRMHWRRPGAQAYSSVELSKDRGVPDGYVATLPAFELQAESRPYELEYYLEVTDAGRRRLAGRGDAYNPLTFRVVPAAGEAQASAGAPWYQNPWVWVVGGAVAAGATAGIIFATQPRTGTVRINVQW